MLLLSSRARSGPYAHQVPELLHYILRMANAATPAGSASSRPASVKNGVLKAGRTGAEARGPARNAELPSCRINVTFTRPENDHLNCCISKRYSVRTKPRHRTFRNIICVSGTYGARLSNNLVFCITFVWSIPPVRFHQPYGRNGDVAASRPYGHFLV